MKTLILIVLIVLCFYRVESKKCKASWECGNMPKAICQNNINLFSGIGVDDINNKVYIMGNFNSSGVPYGSTYIASVPLSGGSLSLEYPILSDIQTGAGFRTAYRLFKYLSKSKLMYTQNAERLAPSIGPYFTNGTLNGIWYPRGFSLAADFDEVAQMTLTCEFSITKYPMIAQDTSIYQNRIELYRTLCQGIGKVGSSFYAVRYNPSGSGSQFFKGDINCVNCDPNTLVILFTDAAQVTGFEVTSSHIFYSSKWYDGSNEFKGIFQVPLSGDLSQKKVLVSDSVDSMELSNNVIYYITGGKVKSVSIASGAVSTLYDNTNSNSEGECACAPGYTGQDCSQCAGDEVWDSNGNPKCLISPPGQKACIYDWMCNQPYGYCDGSVCRCKYNFSGPKCDQCVNGLIKWDSYGNPSCEML
ncbi:hypothetical protein CYY_006786 [Polysphondylium violaceum]|uniref:Laminin EGF-like domain-containing protein n=1 Tax=Polysphondylium violaceum TaxID=133409 RepID=A0A8J4PQ02_9MYCE|nr:hypothetical protein CYY_006786 [Polysphondylium violaceum]